MSITKITIGRLYNLGNYEHVRYELTIEVPDGASAANAVVGMEKILAGLKPLKNMAISSESEIKRLAAEIEEMKRMPAVEWERRYSHCHGTPTEVIERYQQSLEEQKTKRQQAIERARMARILFDDLGGAANWKDAKLDWDDDQESQY